MLLAGRLPLDGLLARLAQERPVFHSEADFQHAFAWHAQVLAPDLAVRLETRPAPGVHLDLLLTGPDGRESAVELKYLTRAWTGQAGRERFELKNQGAHDIRAYDAVKDIARVEAFTATRPGSDGAVLCLSNDASYWNAPNHGRATNAGAFRLHEGLTLAGTRAWGPQTGPGTSRGREAPLHLRGTYRLHWQEFSALPGAAGAFRALVVEVPAATPAPSQGDAPPAL